jgi:hypothetical protein
MNLIGGSSDITRTYTGGISFIATSGTKTITTNGLSLGSTITFNGVGGTWQLQGSFTTSGTMNLTAGTLDTNSQTVTVGTINGSGSTARGMTLGSSTFSTQSWNFATTTNLSFNAGTSTINQTNTVNTFNGGGLTYNNVVFTQAGDQQLAGSNTFANLTLTGTNSATRTFLVSGNQVVTGTFTANGNSAINRINIQSSVKGTQRTITAANVSVTNTDFQDIVGAGAGSWNLSAVSGGAGDCGGNSGITFSTPTTRYWVGGTGNWNSTGEWAASSGGASGATVPLCHDDVVFDANSFSAGSQIVTANMAHLGKNITFAGNGSGSVANTPTWTTSTMANIYGSLTLVSGMNITASTQQYTFHGRSSHTITSAGKTWAKSFVFDQVGGTYTLQDDFLTTGSIVLTSGTLDANDYNFSMSGFVSSTSTTARTINMGNGTWSITFAGAGTLWDTVTTNLTVNAEQSTIKFTYTGSGNQTFSGAGKTYYNLWFDRGSTTSSNIILGSNTFSNLKDTGTAAHSLLFGSGTTQTVSTWTVSGSTGNLITINTSSGTTTHALTKTGGGTIQSDYLSIQHSVATPADTWYAGNNSTNNQAVATAGSGWIFGVADSQAPTLAEVTPVTTPSNDTTPSYTFSTDEAGTITYGGSCSSATTNATLGNNTITFNALGEGTYSNCTVTVTDANANASSPLSVTAFTIDVTAPTITNVNSDKANGNYTVGEIIDIDVTFSEAITSTGNVTITLETGSTDRTCTFTVSNSNTGTCNYTVQSGDTSSDLEVSSISGTIADQAGNAMSNFVPATNLAANKALVVDTTSPTVSITAPLEGATISGASVSVTANASDGVGVVGVQFKLDGSNLGAEDTVSTYGIVWDSTAASEGAHTITAVARDAAGNSTTATTVNITVDNIILPVLTTDEATDFSEEGATLNGNITSIGGENPTDRGFEYGQSVLYGTTITEAGSFSTGSFTALLSGLNCGSQYHYRSFATNSSGTGYGDDIIFETESCPTSSGSRGSSSPRNEDISPDEEIDTEPTEVSIIPPSVGEFFDNIIPNFLKPKPEEEVYIPEVPIEEAVTPETPLVFKDIWNLLPEESIKIFALSPLPASIENLAKKFPEFEQTLQDVNITKVTDVPKFSTVQFSLPGLSETVGLPDTNLAGGKFTIPKGIPIAKLSRTAKARIPSEIIFAKGGAGLIDFNSTLSLNEEGEAEQKITSIVGHTIELVVKPEEPVTSVKGYLVFKEKYRPAVSSLDLPLDSLLASPIFARPTLAKAEEKPVRTEELLVVLEFEYTDPDRDGIYTANVQAPVVAGEYEVITVLNFVDPKLGNKEIRLTTVIDPEGYIYEKNGNKETRIPGAIATIHYLNPATKEYEVWDATEYLQENPQVTDVRGVYSFLVPGGMYYLTVTAPGYKDFIGKPFEVKEGPGVHMNIEMKSKGFFKSLDWKTLLLIVVIILLIYNFYRDRIRWKFRKS